MSEAQVYYQLDLIVHLVDTTTGNSVSERQVMFYGDGSALALMPRDTGFFVLLNHGRKDMHLEVNAAGYLPGGADIRYGSLPGRYPEIEVPMIPEQKTYGHIDLVTMEGCLPGMESIDAVPLKKQYAKVAGYAEKKQTLNLFKAKLMEELAYAVVHEEQMEFEEFRIAKRIDKLVLKLQSPLTAACKPEEDITRIVRGKVDAAGNYLLRVREDADGTEYLVRYVVKGKTKYKRIAFGNPGERRLE